MGSGNGCYTLNNPLHLPPRSLLSSTRAFCAASNAYRLPQPRRWADLCCSTSSSSFSRFRSRSFRTRAAVSEGAVRTTSFYELLGIPEEGTYEDIKRAYKQMARKYHPDVSPPDRTEEYTRRFIEVQEAYETLSDPRARAIYDRDLSRGLHLAFSARRRYDDGSEEKSEWRNRWQGQVAELKKRSTYKDYGGNMSWGARMRMQMAESSAE